MSGVTTRAQKRRIGERDSLWDLIVNNDDICFKHILPRLNQTSWYRFFVVGLGVTWSCGASVPFVSAAVVEERKALAVYPMVLLYVTLGLFAAVVV